ncbi:hypothetical protein BJY00DRAFT_280625, partial [Aspergillus carlsbadensis]
MRIIQTPPLATSGQASAAVAMIIAITVQYLMRWITDEVKARQVSLNDWWSVLKLASMGRQMPAPLMPTTRNQTC